ncbi:MAG: hypothetical protein MMC33_008406 [Icmadophila ericetorum]|nr:hypothetical protein [Icmadophila ericetorum]
MSIYSKAIWFFSAAFIFLDRYTLLPVAADESLCLTNLLGIDAEEILNAAASERMATLCSLMTLVLRSITFYGGPKLTQESLGWAPASFLGHEMSSLRKYENIPGIVSSKGLVVSFPGIILGQREGYPVEEYHLGYPARDHWQYAACVSPVKGMDGRITTRELSFDSCILAFVLDRPVDTLETDQGALVEFVFVLIQEIVDRTIYAKVQITGWMCDLYYTRPLISQRSRRQAGEHFTSEKLSRSRSATKRK